ncbi:MAG TPA: GAP family protein [Nocardioidaceae bacterium]|nr:GAP family protein [Nocardioidaceae bacterium]
MTLAAILPLSFVMIAGPQIISAFFLATSADWARNSLSFLAGAAVSVTVVVTLTYVVATGTTQAAGSRMEGTAGVVIDWIVLAIVLFLIARVYLTRNTSEPPKWMARLQEAHPRFAFLLGMALLGVFPTDILGSITVGLHVAHHGDAWWQCLPFVAMTLLLLALPALGVVVLGRRAEVVLPATRDWMSEKSWVVSEVVLVFFAAITLSSLVSG